MIKRIINFFNNLKCDLSVWHENFHLLEKEKFYKGRKIILMVKKLKNTWEGKILLITYRKNIDITEDSINWKNQPHRMYTANIIMLRDINAFSKEDVQKAMEELFVYYFLEKKEKLKFKK